MNGLKLQNNLKEIGRVIHITMHSWETLPSGSISSFDLKDFQFEVEELEFPLGIEQLLYDNSNVLQEKIEVPYRYWTIIIYVDYVKARNLKPWELVWRLLLIEGVYKIKEMAIQVKGIIQNFKSRSLLEQAITLIGIAILINYFKNLFLYIFLKRAYTVKVLTLK